MTTIPAGLPAGTRSVLIDIGTKLSMAAMVFAAAALALRLSGSELVWALLGCGVALTLIGLARRPVSPLRSLAAHPAAAPAFCGLLGVGAAVLGIHGGLLFLPALFVLLTLSVALERGPLLICSALLAAGFLARTAQMGHVEWSSPCAAVALIALPLAGQVLARRINLGARVDARPEPEPVVDRERLTPRQAEVTALLAGGLRHQEIADRLGVSVPHVRRLARQARERVGARTTAELIASTVTRPRSDH
ncbi:MAG: helix-turn-helix transcriptional regulator [Solirubrobacterales bacterium]|nr:helix-turn-helix transcriptional regulator [Solirubrobacterales bacterium]